MTKGLTFRSLDIEYVGCDGNRRERVTFAENKRPKIGSLFHIRAIK